MKLMIKVKPGSRREKIFTQKMLDGDDCLILAIKEPPVNGKANTAVLKKLADIFDVPRSCIQIDRGVTSQYKYVSIEGDATTLQQSLSNLDVGD